MDACEQENKVKKRKDKLFPFKCSEAYTNELPDPKIDCKFLPCGKSLMDYTEEPISFPQLEMQLSHTFNGLHMLFDIDLINQNCYNQVPGEANEMDPKDAELLTDIEAVQINNSTLKGSYTFLTRAQEYRELLAKKRSTMPRLQHLEPESDDLDLDSFSVEQQIQIIEQTFVDVNRPLCAHPTKSNSSVRPVAQLPVFPESRQLELVQVHFHTPPFANTNSILKDCGSYYINFKQKPEPVFQRINQKYGKYLTAYLSEQRFRVPISETNESDDCVERFILREKDGCLYYQMLSKYIRLQKDQTIQDSFSSLSLLVRRSK